MLESVIVSDFNVNHHGVALRYGNYANQLECTRVSGNEFFNGDFNQKLCIFGRAEMVTRCFKIWNIFQNFA